MERGEARAPSITAVLDVDEEYRRKASEGKLRTISPRRFNPEGEAWLPVLHTDRKGWQFTALFSNTALAHELNKTRDWVVIYYEKDGHENQHTIVTELHGAMKGRRVVRGRERETLAFYSSKPDRSPFWNPLCQKRASRQAMAKPRYPSVISASCLSAGRSNHDPHDRTRGMKNM